MGHACHFSEVVLIDPLALQGSLAEAKEPELSVLVPVNIQFDPVPPLTVTAVIIQFEMSWLNVFASLNMASMSVSYTHLTLPTKRIV